MAKIRIRDKTCPTNPKKMIEKKKKIFRLRRALIISCILNVAMASFLLFNNL